MSHSAALFQKLLDLIAKLRDPNGGCPWDLEQTHESLRPYAVEEVYEVLEAIDAGDDSELQKELGDLLLQVVLHAQVAKDRGAFSIDQVLEQISEKMIRRHPHVFGDRKVSGSDDVVKNWEEIKAAERGVSSTEKRPSALDGIPFQLPALLRAQRIGEKAAAVKFDWESLEGVWAKVHEEVGELEIELTVEPRDLKRIEHELGDLLFTCCQLARTLGISAEDALRTAGTRFTARFAMMEQLSQKPLQELSLGELEAMWAKAKRDLAS